MPADVLPLLIAIIALTAFVLAARTWMMWRSVVGASDSMRHLTADLDSGPARITKSTATFRGKLAEANADVERGLWSLARFDERSGQLEEALRTRRAGLDLIRERYLGSARRGMANIRRAVQMFRQLMELRRTFLG